MEPSPFHALGLDPRIAAAVNALGFTEPTPIQAAAIPVLLSGQDVVGRARTGSGKTAAFALPMLHRLRDGGRATRALVLTPTRELALQVTEAIASLGAQLQLTVVPVYGGAAYGPQLKALHHGATVVVGTPGRVLDHLDRGTLDLRTLEVLVLDEADEMLRMGFVDEVERILAATPPTRQVALFSATMPEPIRRIAATHLRNPAEVQVESSAMSTHHVVQQWIAVPPRRKVEALVRVLRGTERGGTLVFARTRAACAEVADALAESGFSADALHGDLSQAARELVLARFRSGRVDVLVATDVAARGLDVDGITHVINLDLPPDVASYVHRIGRTGRAGREGVAISFVGPAEKHRLRTLCRSLRVDICEERVPNDRDIARRRQERLLRALVEVHAEGASDEAEAWLAEAAARSGLDASALATAALVLFARQRQVPLESVTDGPVPIEDEVRVFLAVGRQHGVGPADVVGALTNGCGLPGTAVGRISLFDRKCIVALPRAAAERLVADGQPLSIRGNPVRVAMARAD